MKLSERIAKLESGAAKGLTEIIIKGGLPGSGEDDHAGAGEMTWHRGADETVASFKTRVRSGIPFGEKFLIWGGLPE